MQRGHQQIRLPGQPLAQPLGQTLDLSGAGQKDQQTPRLLSQRLKHHGPTLRHQRLLTIDAAVVIAQWIGPPLAVQQLGIGQQSRKIQAIEGSRHHQQPEIGPQCGAGFNAQRQCQIGMQTAFVKLIEDQQPNPGELGIGLQHARQYPFGDDLQLSRATDPTLATHPVTDAQTDLLAQLFGQKTGYVAGRQAAWLQHDDAARDAARPQQSQWQGRRLTGTGRRLQHHRAIGAYGRQQGWINSRNRQLV